MHSILKTQLHSTIRPIQNTIKNDAKYANSVVQCLLSIETYKKWPLLRKVLTHLVKNDI